MTSTQKPCKSVWKTAIALLAAIHVALVAFYFAVPKSTAATPQLEQRSYEALKEIARNTERIAKALEELARKK